MTTNVQIEMQIVAIQCQSCRSTMAVAIEADITRFWRRHRGHKLTYLAKITAPEAFVVEGQIQELEFSPGEDGSN